MVQNAIILFSNKLKTVQRDNYILLSRKYRPTNFANLKGQDILVKSLSFAILNNKLAQSYLLTGIRGIGKTTTARIIAKTINCTNLQNNNKIPKACDECSNCKASIASSHPDIIEIDAASRTGVDDIRVIIENAEYKPMQGDYKVFIIDEVHMLSKSAFNALLKLLEEPPNHCLFIFATTEVHKIPLTIISRCQRFDLLRFTIEDLEKLLLDICEKESINYALDAIKTLCIKADGSARDALSLLDQARILMGNNSEQIITKEMVDKMVSAVNQSLIVEFLEKIIAKDSTSSLGILEDFYKTNADFVVFIRDFLSLLGYVAKKLAIKDYSAPTFYSYEGKISELSSKVDMTFAQIAWQLSYKTQTELKHSSNQLEHIQMLALKLIYLISSKSGVSFEFDVNKETHANIIQDSREVFEVAKSSVPKNSKNFSFDGFLKYLHERSEMDLYYTLFNKAEIFRVSDNLWHIKVLKSNSKIDNELKSRLNSWSAGKIEIKLEYVDNLISHKEHLKDKISSNEAFVKLSKNFADVQITDILMRPN